MTATILSMEELDALVSSEPMKDRVRDITVTRTTNLDSLVQGDAPAMDVSSETKSDGSSYKLESILAAYRAIIKERKMGDTVTVLHFKVAKKVVLKKVA